MKGKAEFFFAGNYIFFKADPKRVANLLGLVSDLKIKSLFLTYKFFLKPFCDFIELDPDWIRIRIHQNIVDPDTINSEPHH